MRLIDKDELNMVKFHPLPYTHIVPADLLKGQTEAYERGWNDAIDAIIENAETIEERKTGRWIESNPQNSEICRLINCSECGKGYIVNINVPYEDWTDAHKFCVECGAKMEVEHE